MNRELLLKVADHIEAHPDRYDQAEWFQHFDENGDVVAASYVKPDVLADTNVCNTTCCVAGWALTFAIKADPTGTIGRIIDANALDSDGDIAWDMAGALVLDLEEHVARQLFSWTRDESVMPSLLRVVAAYDGPIDSDLIEALEADLLAKQMAETKEEAR